MLHTDIIQTYYWVLNFGKVKIKKQEFDFFDGENFKGIKPPIFFLSTGRTATKWFAHLFNKAKGVIAFHEAMPLMRLEAKYAYQLWNDNQFKYKAEDILKQIFLATRMEYLIYSIKTEKRFLETNHYLTFYAPVIAKLIPNSKFVHIYRHPGDFIRSGLIRGWYKPDNSNNITLLNCNCPQWKKMDRIEKLAWLWKETNTFMENFITSVNKDRVYRFNFSDIKNPDKLMELSSALNLEIKRNTIERMINKPKNKNKKETYPKYKNWSKEDKEKIWKIVGDLAEKYGFKP